MTSPISPAGWSRRRLLQAGATSALLAGVGASAAACSKSTSATTGGSTTLNVAFFGDQSAADKASQAAASFKAAHPGVNVKFTGTNGTDWNDFFAKLLTQIAAGNAPDMAAVATEGLQLFAAKNLALPLDDYVKRDAAELKPYFADVHPSLIEAMMYQGHLYELPTDFNAGNMFYNASLFASVGVDRPADGWTKDDFYNIAKKVSGKGGGVVGWDWVVRLWGSWTSWMYANGGNLLSEGKWDGGDWLWNTFYPNDPAATGRKGGWKWGDPTANSAPTVEALDFMIQLQKEALSPQPDVGGGTTLQGLFASNKIGMAIGGGFWAGGLHNAGMATGSFDVQFFPKWKSQRHLFGTAGYGIFQSSKNKDLAWEFLKTLIQPSTIDLLIPGNDSTPTRKSMMTAAKYAGTGPTNWQVFYDTLTKFEDTAPIPAPPYYNAMAIALNKRTTQAMSSGSAKAALDGLQSDLESAAKNV
ncbi:MAG TPA: sugar ABC transporter substrate-binding protein [Rugosimonospora sp.]|nr:sugar ABC transporter substrate-binding protein [Rugosimonospora sp.]